MRTDYADKRWIKYCLVKNDKFGISDLVAYLLLFLLLMEMFKGVEYGLR